MTSSTPHSPGSGTRLPVEPDHTPRHATFEDPAPADSSTWGIVDPSAAVQRPGLDRRRVVVVFSALVIPLLMAAALSGSYLKALQHPTPHGMKVEIIGTTPQAQKVAVGLSVQTAHRFDVTTVATPADAQHDIRSLEVRGAYNPATAELWTATAGSPLATQTITQLFTSVAQQDHRSLTVHDLVPRSEHDTSGLSLLFMSLGATLCGYMSASVVSMAAPRLSTSRHLGVIAGMSIVGAITITFVTYGVYGAYTSHLAPVLGLLALAQFCAALFQYAGYRMIGAPMTLVSILVMVVLGSPASGVFVPADMMPSLYRWPHPLLPTSALAEALRRVLDFDATGTARSITVLLAWIMASLWMLHVADLRLARSAQATAQPQPESTTDAGTTTSHPTVSQGISA